MSRISQTLRRYLITAFWLRPTEMTTAELTAALGMNRRITAELTAAFGEFLRTCDERKFSLPADAAPQGAAGRALELVELAEAQRLRPPPASSTATPPA